MAEEVFVCPLCGAPYRTPIPSGVVQVKCQYCGGTVLVPPRLGGTVQRCPNHPEALAVGLCNDCNKSYCDRCLYIFKVEHGSLHLCSGCYDSRSSMKMLGVVLFLAFSAVLFLAFFGLLVSPSALGAGASMEILFYAIMLSVLAVVAFSEAKVRRLTVREAVERGVGSPKSFLKKCVGCGREIPIASEECARCGAKQPEYCG